MLFRHSREVPHVPRLESSLSHTVVGEARGEESSTFLWHLSFDLNCNVDFAPLYILYSHLFLKNNFLLTLDFFTAGVS